VAERRLPVSEKLSDDVISLPIHAYLDEQRRIASSRRCAARSLPDFPVSRICARSGACSTHLHRRRLHAALAADRIRARHHASPRFWRRSVADAFFVALRLPIIFARSFAEGAFNAAFVPAYAHLHGKSESGRQIVRRPHLHAAVCCPGDPARRGWWFMPEVIAILAPGFKDDRRAANSRFR